MLKPIAKLVVAGIGILAAKACIFEEIDEKLNSFEEALMAKIECIFPEVY